MSPPRCAWVVPPPGFGAMISNTGQYGIRALVYLSAVATDSLVPSAAVAAATGLPPNYLTKVLNTLVHVGILESTRGPERGIPLLGTAGGPVPE